MKSWYGELFCSLFIPPRGHIELNAEQTSAVLAERERGIAFPSIEAIILHQPDGSRADDMDLLAPSNKSRLATFRSANASRGDL